jgi:hypothetical protein
MINILSFNCGFVGFLVAIYSYLEMINIISFNCGFVGFKWQDIVI